jgi:hypothetical protein
MRQDQDGYFYFVDRIKGTIRRRDENLSYLAGRRRKPGRTHSARAPRRVRRRRHIGPIRAPPPPSPVRRKTLIFLAFPTYIDLAQRLLYF